MTTVKIGNRGEELACRYIQNLGYQVLQRNFRIRGGEIDIVAKEKDILVFVEVKTRYSHQYGLPIEAITPFKIRSLLKTAGFYLQKVKWGDKPYRLDVVSIDYAETSDNPQIDLYQNITG